jgi:hypothetical protein
MASCEVGKVYVVYTVLAKPPKDKITICVCAAENLFLWINTNPRSNAVGQFALTARDHSALTHDCYLDCSRVTTFAEAELESAHHRGPISKALAERIVDFLDKTPPKTLPGKHLKLIIANLSKLA